MSETIAQTSDKIQSSEIGFFEKWLTVWVFLCIVAGVILGQVLPGVFKAIWGNGDRQS
jgi:ACR3 family arsenite transporter